jgi:hypothetical protein
VKKKRVIRTTRFEQSILCTLFAREPASLSLSGILDGMSQDTEQVKVLWSLKILETMKLVERGTDRRTYQLTPLGRAHWRSLVEKASV